MNEQSLFSHALAYLRRGFSVIPIGGKRKKPALRKYKEFKRRCPTEAEVQAWFSRPSVNGIGLLCGPVSGGLTVRDFDTMESYDAWCTAQPELAAILPTVETKRGRHVYFRSNFNRDRDVNGPDGKTTGEMKGKGYVLAPPSRHPSGLVYKWLIPLPDGPLPEIDPGEFTLPGTEVPCDTEDVEDTEYTEDVEDKEEDVKPPEFSVSHVVPSVSHEELEKHRDAVDAAIARTLPPSVGMRHKRIFALARALRAIPGLGDCKALELKHVVAEWHKRALPFIGTKPLVDTLADFYEAWPRVKYPAGSGPVDDALVRARQADVPDVAAGYDQPDLQLLVAWCRELHNMAAGEPFFLSCRVVGTHLGVDHATAARWLRFLVNDGVLGLVKKGTKSSGYASKYYYLGPIKAVDNSQQNGDT